MNLNKLFDTQRLLDARIEKEHPRVEGEDRLAKKILALQVELGELANEQRSWKFWSKDQEPRTKVFDEEYDSIHMESIGLEQKNPLLEEYVDCLHFILSIGLDYKIDIKSIEVQLKDFNKWETVDKQFNYIFHLAGYLPYISQKEVIDKYYVNLFVDFVGLGEMLGFTWEQIETAYYSKNAINHTRQDTGY